MAVSVSATTLKGSDGALVTTIATLLPGGRLTGPAGFEAPAKMTRKYSGSRVTQASTRLTRMNVAVPPTWAGCNHQPQKYRIATTQAAQPTKNSVRWRAFSSGTRRGSQTRRSSGAPAGAGLGRGAAAGRSR